MSKKIILVIGGTGAQGQVISQYLAPAGVESPYALRILTRDPTNARAKELYGNRADVELVKGSFTDFDTVEEHLQGCYGVFVNTDGWVEGPANELYAGIRLFEISNRVPGLKHFIYSSIPYPTKLSGFQKAYSPGHMDTRGRVTDYLRSQPSGQGGLTWSVVTIGLYTDNLSDFMAPRVLEDGTRAFVLPLKQGHVWLYNLEDGAYWTRQVFDHPEHYSGVVIDALGEAITGQGIADAFAEVTGLKAVYVDIDFDKYADFVPYADKPVSFNNPQGLTWRENFRKFWATWADDAIYHARPDLTERRILHPQGARTVKQWMIDHKYDGSSAPILNLTKIVTDRAHFEGK